MNLDPKPTFKHHPHGIVLPKLTRENTPKGRMYSTPTGNAYPSITTVLGVTDDKKWLFEWQARVGKAEAARITAQSARRGTAVHKLAEDYLDNVEDWKGKAQPANLHMFKPLRKILDEKVNNIWFQEEFLYSDKLRTAGQVDCIGEYRGVLSVIDFKTARRPKTVEDILNYFIQVTFYAAAFFEMTGVAIKQGAILIAVENEEPQEFIFDIYDYFPHFLAVRKKFKELKE
jgi:genome maintenance exonuclease 1